MVTPDAIVIRTLPNLEGKKAFEISPIRLIWRKMLRVSFAKAE
jgi:hypothetical protein